MIWNHILKTVAYLPCSVVLSLMMAYMLRVRRPVRYVVALNLSQAVLYVVYAFCSALPGAQTFRLVSQFAILIFFSLAFSRESWLRRGLVFALVMLVMMAGEAVSVSIYLTMGGQANAQFEALAAEQPLAFCLCEVVNLLTTSLLAISLSGLWDRLILKTSNKTLLYFVLFPLSQCIILWECFTLIARITTMDQEIDPYYLQMSVLMLVCFAADVLLFRVMRRSTEQAVAEERAAWSENLLHQQEVYYTQVLADTEDASRIRHDIRNQLQVAYTLMAEGNIEAAKDQLDGISLRLEAAPSHCANRVVNALLSVKEERFAQDGIPFEIRCDVPAQLPLEGVELCSLFSNVLDNAYRAALALPTEERTAVTLTAGISRNYFILTCTNPTAQGPQPAPEKGHGLGLNILRELAQRHNGAVKAEQNGGQFKTSVWLELGRSGTTAQK